MEIKTISYKHSYNAGDLISVLCGMQHIYRTQGKKAVIYQRLDFPAFYYEGAEHPVKDISGNQVCMNEAIFNMLRVLLVEQEYIEDFVVWKGEKCDIDFDASRDRKAVPMPYSAIHHWPFFVVPELSCDLSIGWISPIKNGDTKIVFDELQHVSQSRGKIVINRTSRYQNPYIHYHFLKKYSDKLIFAGTRDEYDEFIKLWFLDIPYLNVGNFFELTQCLSAAKAFLGNQSFCWHLADAMKIPRILEVCSQFPNTLPTGANGYAFLYQEALELYVHKLLIGNP